MQVFDRITEGKTKEGKELKFVALHLINSVA
jgi:hypothetical protein